jgi:hypothetical protein
MKGRIQRKCYFMSGWDMKYTRPPKKEQNIRLGGAHGLTSKARPSGGFKGLKTWNISCQVSRVKGVENRGSSGHFVGEYIERPEECIIAYGDSPEEGKKKYAELEEKLFKQKKNSVIQRRLNIPLPKEILNDPQKVEKLLKTLQNNYFSSCYAFSAALHKSENFKNPHIHVQYSNVDGNFKAIREFQDPALLDSVKKDIKYFIESELWIKCAMKGIGKGIKHYLKWIAGALKRAEEAERRGDGGKMMREYAEKYPLFNEYISERNRKYSERAIQLKENKLKKATEGEIVCVEEFSEKIKKKANSFLGKFYSQKEKEQIKKDLEVNQQIIDDLKKKAAMPDYATELAEKEQLEKKRKAKTRDRKTEDIQQEKDLKTEDQNTENLGKFIKENNLKPEDIKPKTPKPENQAGILNLNTIKRDR